MDHGRATLTNVLSHPDGSLESVEGQTDHDWAAHGRIRTNLPKMDMKDEGFPRR